MRIGVDFDNTLACYDELFAALASEEGLLSRTPPGGKRGVRDAVRKLPDGELAWRRLQGLAYGRHMARATLFPGAGETLARWRGEGARIFIISHKTRVSADDPRGVDLRRQAMAWLRAHDLVGAETAPVRAEDVFFNDNRADKLARIARLGCDLFVDDLEEVFREPAFPPATVAVLFDPHGTTTAAGPWHRIDAWSELNRREAAGAAA